VFEQIRALDQRRLGTVGKTTLLAVLGTLQEMFAV